MNLLVDSHVALRAMADDPRVGRARPLITDPANEVYFSAASAWEIAIKTALRKLDIEGNLESWLPARLAFLQFYPMPVTWEHALAVEHLPRHHRDPFDRLLIAQGEG